MAKRLKIPDALLSLNPDLTMKELRTIINVVLSSRRNRMRQAYIFDIKLPSLGRIRSHGNKKHKFSKAVLLRDRRRKEKENKEKELKKEKLLW